LRSGSLDPALAAGLSNTQWLGLALYTRYLLPFEVAALILTVGVIAAVALTLRERKDARYENASRQVKVTSRQRLRMVKMSAAHGDESTAPEEPRT